MIKRKTIPGPPLKEAVPMVEKMPAPITAAIPIKVRSRTPNTFRKPPPCPSLRPAAESATILSIDFFLKRESDMKFGFRFKAKRIRGKRDKEFRQCCSTKRTDLKVKPSF